MPVPYWDAASLLIFNAPASAVDGFLLGTGGVSPSEVAAAGRGVQWAQRQFDEFGNEISNAAQGATALIWVGGALLLYLLLKK